MFHNIILQLPQVDRDAATVQRCGETASQMFDLFAALGAAEEQLDFPMLYASARQVRCGRRGTLNELATPPTRHSVGLQ